MWDLPGPGLEPMSPALAGGFLTIVPPGQSKFDYLDELLLNHGFHLGQIYSQLSFVSL